MTNESDATSSASYKKLVLSKCPGCNFATESKELLSSHLSIHDFPVEMSVFEELVNFKCSLCGFTNQFEDLMISHVGVHDHDNNNDIRKAQWRESLRVMPEGTDLESLMEFPTFTCTICRMTFDKKRKLTCHALLHAGVKVFMCGDCQYVKLHRSYLIDHIQRVHKNTTPRLYVMNDFSLKLTDHKCDNCERLFLTESEAKEHPCERRRDPRMEKNKTHRTRAEWHKEIRQRSLKRKQKMKMELEERAKKRKEKKERKEKEKKEKSEMSLTCDVCGYVSPGLTHFALHKQFHSKLWSLSCKHCGIATKNKQALRDHLKTHDDVDAGMLEYFAETPAMEPNREDVFMCDLCDYTSVGPVKMKQHQLTHAEKKWTCDLCDFASSRKQHLRRHMQTHSTEKKYKCDDCEFAAVTRARLTRHRKQHLDIKPYRCQKCGFAFTQLCYLKRHLQFAERDEAFKCRFCCHTNSVRNAVRLHERRSHPEEKPTLKRKKKVETKSET